MLIQELKDLKETAWRNPGLQTISQAMQGSALTMADIQDAAARLERFAAYFRVAFPETEKTICCCTIILNSTIFRTVKSGL